MGYVSYVLTGFGSLAALFLFASSGADPYVGHKAVRVQAETPAQAELAQRAATRLLDEQTHVGTLHLIVDDQGLAELERAGVAYEVTEEDVHGRLVAEQERLAAGAEVRDFDAWFDDFKTLDQIYDRAYELAQLEPDFVDITVIGESVEGRPILGIKIGNGQKPTVAIEGVQHAREWLASMVPMCVLDRIVNDLDSDPIVQRALEGANLTIVPIVNPDGFEYTWTDDRFWRKNRRAPYGTDLNRNWGQGWGDDIGSSDDPESEIYRGSSPFSEPETSIVRDFVSSHPVAALVDFHTFGAIVASSWAYTNQPPPDLERLVAWGDAMGDQLNGNADYGYQSLHSADANEVLGFAAGTQPDWAHAEFGVPAYTIELRPRFDDEEGGHFEVPPETILTSCEEAVPVVLDLLRWVGSSDELGIAITSPQDGQVFSQNPANTQIEIDVDFAGPVSEVRLMINGELQPWNDTVFPHEANIEFPNGSYELIAVATTWDGQHAESAPITITVDGSIPPDDTGPGPGTDTGGDGDGDGDGSDDGGSGHHDEDEPSLLGRDGCGGCSANGSAPTWSLLLVLAFLRRRR